MKLPVLGMSALLVCAAIVIVTLPASSQTPDNSESTSLVSRAKPLNITDTAPDNGDIYLSNPPAPFTAAGIFLSAHPGSFPWLCARSGTADGNSGFAFYNSANAELMRIRADGNVGIGTIAPALPLEVAQSSVYPAINVLKYGGRASIGLGLDNGTASTTGIVLGRDSMNNGTNDFYLWDLAQSAFRLVVDHKGNVGVGTSTPASKLDVNQGAAGNNLVGELADFGYTTDATRRISFWQMTNNGGSAGPTTLDQFMFLNGKLDTLNSAYDNPKCTSAYGGCTGFRVSDSGLTILTSSTAGANVTPVTALKILSSNGNVGIGVPSPSAKLDVNGSANVAGNLTVTGSITGGTVIGAVYRDLAEWVSSGEELPAGTVVVVDPDHRDQVRASDHAYDTAVAGVVSDRPGIVLGESSALKSKVATTGRVRVKASADGAPIRIGDLLVTSDIGGLAMKSQPIEIQGRKFHQPGTVIGKALEPLPDGHSEILVLLSLQ